MTGIGLATSRFYNHKRHEADRLFVRGKIRKINLTKEMKMNRFVPLSLAFASVMAFMQMIVPAQAQYAINSTTLNSYVGVHPRLFVSSGSIATLKTNIAAHQSGTPRWGEMWVNFKNIADVTAVKPAIAYTTPGASDEQLWQREVGDNMAILAMAQVLTRVNDPSPDTMWFEAEDAPLTSPMTVTADPTVSGGAYISTPVGGAVNSPNTQPPSVVYRLAAQSNVSYHVWALVYAPSSTANSWYFNIDGTEQNLSTTTYGSWIWVNCGHYYLTPGNHAMSVTYQKQGVRFDKFVVTTDYNLTPAGFGTEQHWVEASNFTLNANGSGTHLYNLPLTTTDSQAVYGDALSLSQKWLEPWVGEANASGTPVSTATPDAQQTVGLNGGNYDIWVRFKAPYKGHDSFYFEYDTIGYNLVALDGTVTFPYNTLVSPTLLTYNSTLTAPNNSYPYREWVWKKVADNVALAAGNHTLKLSLGAGNGNASVAIDRCAVLPAGSTAPADPNKYLAAACKWAIASTNYATWGTGSYANDDLAAAHQLFGLSIVYDWCNGDLCANDRTIIGNTLNTKGALMNTAATSTAWWKSSYLMNHLWEDTCGLTASALAIYGDTGYTESTQLAWMNTALTKLNNTMTYLGDDGADQEGVGYYGYGIEHLLKYMDMANKIMGMNMYSTPWFEQSSNYRLYFDLPSNSQTISSTHINFSDDPGYDWNGPDYLLRELANKYTLPVAQWQAEQYDTKKINYSNNLPFAEGAAPWLNLVWYNSGVSETSPINAGLPTMGYFDNMEFAVSRSGWDGTESVMAYQCGPFMGHWVQHENTTNYVDWGGNHVHPAASNFCLFGYGAWLIQNDGYASGRYTNQSNTLLINNAGQLGEGGSDGFLSSQAKGEDPGGVLNPAIDNTLSYSTPTMDYFVGNATACYAAADGLTKYRRHILYLKPDVLVAVDDVTLNSSLPLELHFYPQNVLPTSLGSGVYSTTASNGTKLNFSLMTPTASVISTPQLTWASGGGNHYCYKITPTGGSASAWSNAVAMTWAPTGSTPKPVTMIADSDGTAWKFKVGTSTMVLDRNAGHALDEKARAVTTLEAESVALGSSMQTYADATASGGTYISTTSGTAAKTPTDTLTSPSALYSFTVPTTGSYAIWARIQAPNSSSNSFYYYINPSGTPTYTSNASTTTYGSWVWVQITGSTSLSAGANMLGLKYRSPGCKIDQIIVTSDTTYTPYGMY